MAVSLTTGGTTTTEPLRTLAELERELLSTAAELDAAHNRVEQLTTRMSAIQKKIDDRMAELKKEAAPNTAWKT